MLARAGWRGLWMYEIVLAVPEPRSGYFLLLVQEKVPKEKDTPNGANVSCASRRWGPRRITAHPCAVIRERTSCPLP